MIFGKNKTKAEKDSTAAADYTAAVTGWENGRLPGITVKDLFEFWFLLAVVVGVPLIILICIFRSVFLPYHDRDFLILFIPIVVIPVTLTLLFILLMYLQAGRALKKLDSCTGMLTADSRTVGVWMSNLQIMEADRYLFSLISFENSYEAQVKPISRLKFLKELIVPAESKFSEELMQEIRQLRDECFHGTEADASAARVYIRRLCDINPEFAQEREFGGMKKPEKDALQSTAAGRPAHDMQYQWSAYRGIYDENDYDDIDLQMEEFIDDEIIFRGGNPYDWHDRAEYMKDPFGFGDHDDYGEDDR